MLTDPITKLHAAMRSRPALIVHFSGVPKGTGHPMQYPGDLAKALADTQEILCCSTIEPGDLARRPPAATGSVGVVVGPIDEASIIFVHHDDVGSSPSTAERRKRDRRTTVADCVRSFTRDGVLPYNEWLVGPYRVIGLFVACEAQVQVAGKYCDVDPDDVLAVLGDWRVFSDMRDGFVERDGNGNWQALDISSVYP